MGDFVNNKFNGSGEIKFNNGDTYKGLLIDNIFNGLGIYNYQNGNIYEGQF